MLTDDSAGEQRAVAAGFPGLSAGEQEVTHLLCTKHSDATIVKKFPGPALLPVARALRSALHQRRTRMGCEQSLAEALSAAPSKELRAYIQKEWVETAASWANYARTHSPLLLQVPTTNPLERFHSALKYGVKAAIKSWSLQGIVIHIANVALGYDRRAEAEERSWRAGSLPEVRLYPGIERLPVPIQKLILREREKGELLVAEGEDPREVGKETECDCLFWRRYSLPCRHLFQVDMLIGGMFREEDWDEVKPLPFYASY